MNDKDKPKIIASACCYNDKGYTTRLDGIELSQRKRTLTLEIYKDRMTITVKIRLPKPAAQTQLIEALEDLVGLHIGKDLDGTTICTCCEKDAEESGCTNPECSYGAAILALAAAKRR